MAITNEFKDMIDEDISSLKDALSDNSNSVTLEYAKQELYNDITAKYNSYIPQLSDGLYGYKPSTKMYLASTGAILFRDLRILLKKLEAFKAAGYPSLISDIKGNIDRSVSVNPIFNLDNKNSNVNQILINVSFEQVRQQIENMTALSAEETDDIFNKIDELENIVRSDDNRKRKWDKIRPLLMWVADKGVDVGIALLPLLLQIR